jgi:hypothetical protein
VCVWYCVCDCESARARARAHACTSLAPARPCTPKPSCSSTHSLTHACHAQVDPAAAIMRNRTEQQQAGGAERESAKKTSKKRKEPEREHGDALCVKKKVCACMQVCVDAYFARMHERECVCLCTLFCAHTIMCWLTRPPQRAGARALSLSLRAHTHTHTHRRKRQQTQQLDLQKAADQTTPRRRRKLPRLILRETTQRRRRARKRKRNGKQSKTTPRAVTLIIFVFCIGGPASSNSI